MKRAVFIVLIVGLLVCAEAVTLMATRAASTGGPVEIEGIQFFYKMDAHARYLELKNHWQASHRGELPLSQAEELATEADAKSSVESPFDRWLYHGGPSPNVFKGKVHLYNTSSQALLDVPLQVTVRAKVGELRVNPDIQMTDFNHLKRTARWVTVSRSVVRVPALAPGEDMLVEVMEFHLLRFLADHPNQWPVEVEVQLSSPKAASVKQALELVPDHFVVPVLY